MYYYLLLNCIVLYNNLASEENIQQSFIYKGGWPINQNSHNVESMDLDFPCPGSIGCDCKDNRDCFNNNCRSHPKGNYCVPKPGDQIPRFEAIDQFGESVDLYDFANQGKMILIELSAAWCKPCNDLSSWITNNDNKIKQNRWWKEQYQSIRKMINNEEIFLINYMFEGMDKVNKVTATPNDVFDWYKKYPDPNIPVLADEYRFVHSWVRPTGLPCIFLIDENMQLITYTNRGLTEAFLYLTDFNYKE